MLALEVMVPNPAIRNLIREDKVHQIYSQMQVGQAKFGMQTFNQALAALLAQRLITPGRGLRPLLATPRSCRTSSPAAAADLPGQRPAGGAPAVSSCDLTPRG